MRNVGLGLAGIIAAGSFFCCFALLLLEEYNQPNAPYAQCERAHHRL